MRAALASLLASVALLTGCGGERAVNNQAARIRIANPPHERLSALSPGNQRLGMFRAIRDSGLRCQRVDNVGYQEEYRDMRMWVAVCGAEQKTYAVFIAPNEGVQVRDCQDAGTLSLPRCAPLPPPVADPTMPEFKEGSADEAFRNGS